MSKSHILTLDIEIYDQNISDSWSQGKYLVHGYDDLFWTDSLDDALLFLKQSVIDGERGETYSGNSDNCLTPVQDRGGSDT